MWTKYKNSNKKEQIVSSTSTYEDKINYKYNSADVVSQKIFY